MIWLVVGGRIGRDFSSGGGGVVGVDRKSREWKRLYARRTSVARIFGRLKEHRRLERHCYRRVSQDHGALSAIGTDVAGEGPNPTGRRSRTAPMHQAGGLSCMQKGEQLAGEQNCKCGCHDGNECCRDYAANVLRDCS